MKIVISFLVVFGIMLASSGMSSAQQTGFFIIPTASITIDGDISDWEYVEPAYVDDVNDENPDADFEGTDLHKLYLAKDKDYLYILMTLFDGAPKTDYETNYSFEAIQHPTELHTPGDRTVTALYTLDGKSEWHAHVGERLYPDGHGQGIASYPPSYVGAGANFIEFKAYLSDLGDLNLRYIRTYIHPHGASDPPYPPLSDENITGIQIIDGEDVEAAKDFTTRFYQLCLDRNPDSASLNFWAAGLLDGSLVGSDVAKGFIYSPEFIEKKTSNEEYLTILYKAFFNRDPDPAGWDIWLTELDEGKDRGEVLDGFILANEFSAFCHQYGIKPIRTLQGFITGIVYDAFTKEPIGSSSIIVNSVLESKVKGLPIQCLPNGRYFTHALQPGTYSLTAQAPGYISKYKSNIVIQEADLERVNFYLAPVSVVADFVTRFYQLCLGRDPDPSGLDVWVNELLNESKSGADVAWGFVFSTEFTRKLKSDEEYLTILYRAFFNREPDQAGWDGWLVELEKGSGRDEVLEGFIYAVEFKKLCEDYGIVSDFARVRNFVTRFYQQCLGRGPDSAGLSRWIKDLRDGSKTGADVAWGFVFSSEFVGKNKTNAEYLEILYKAFFNRDPDPAGWDVWIAELDAGKDRGEVLNGFLGSQEFIKLCMDYGITPY